jgi:hypothetical protein
VPRNQSQGFCLNRKVNFLYILRKLWKINQKILGIGVVNLKVVQIGTFLNRNDFILEEKTPFSKLHGMSSSRCKLKYSF